VWIKRANHRTTLGDDSATLFHNYPMSEFIFSNLEALHIERKELFSKGILSKAAIPRFVEWQRTPAFFVNGHFVNPN